MADENWPHARIRVENMKTLTACSELAATYRRVGVLSFASGRRPGGAFLDGARAQEESLLRSSGLYPSLLTCPQFYEYHRNHTGYEFSDHIIMSPACVVFRSPAEELLEVPYFVDVITCASPDAAMLDAEDQPLDALPIVLTGRARKVIDLAALRGCEALVLGAWGCGVHGNDPRMVAQAFATALTEVRRRNRFREVVFAVWDTSPVRTTLQTFARALRA